MGTHPIFESDFDCLTGKRLKMELSDKAAKLFAARRARSEKFAQCGWGTCSEYGSETEAISDEAEDELYFSDTDAPSEWVEPRIRSATPSQPAQALDNAGGRGSKLFKIRQQRMNNYTKAGTGKLSGLPTGKLNDRQRCGYVALTKYDLPPDLDDPSGKGDKPKALETAEEKKARDPTFIDMTMPPPKKITLPKVVIEKPDGPLPFQYLRPSQYASAPSLLERPSSATGEVETGSSMSFKPWRPSNQQYRSVKAPVHGMNVRKMKPVVNVPKSNTEFGSEIGEISTRKYQKINFYGRKQGPFEQQQHSKNVTAVGFKKPQMSRIETGNNRRMSVKDLLVNNGNTPQPYKPSPSPCRDIPSALGKSMHDTQIDHFMEFNRDKEDRCPTRAQQMPPNFVMKTGQAPQNSLFQPKKFTASSASVWAPRS